MLRPYNKTPGPRDVPILRYGDVARQCRAAELPQVDVEDDMLGGAEVLRHASSGIELQAVPLPVPEGKGVTGKAVGLGDGECGGGVEAAGEEHDCAGTVHGSGNLVEMEGLA